MVLIREDAVVVETQPTEPATDAANGDDNGLNIPAIVAGVAAAAAAAAGVAAVVIKKRKK
jgi:hypothetical protein